MPRIDALSGGVLILMFSATAQAVDLFTDMELGAQLGPERFHWTDLDRQDNVIGKEKGSRTAVSASYANDYRRSTGILLGASGIVSASNLTYAGDAWSGVQVPPSQVTDTQANTDSNHLGLELHGGYRYVSGRVGYNLLGGIRHDIWERNIADGVSSTGDTTYGHDEQLMVTTLRINAGVDLALPRFRLALAFGPMFPAGRRSVDLRAPTADEHFSVDVSFLHAYFATLTAFLDLDDSGHHRATVGGYWSEYRSKAARDVYVSPGGAAYLQPGTELGSLGMQLGYSYRF